MHFTGSSEAESPEFNTPPSETSPVLHRMSLHRNSLHSKSLSPNNGPRRTVFSLLGNAAPTEANDPGLPPPHTRRTPPQYITQLSRGRARPRPSLDFMLDALVIEEDFTRKEKKPRLQPASGPSLGDLDFTL